MKPPARPLFVFDGECGFCREWIERWRRATGEAVDYAPFQEVAGRFPKIGAARFAEAAHLIEEGGRVSRGAEAVFRSLAYARAGGIWAWCYRWLPGLAPVSELLYRWVASHRPLCTRVTHLLWGKHVVPPGDRWTTSLFVRAIGAIYTIGFLSLWPQIVGLVGRQGIYPVEGFLEIVRSRLGLAGYWLYPTLSWLSPTDGFLHALCAAGTAAGLLVAAGVAPALCLGIAWVAYLSLATVGQDFLWFQWDSLLLETGFVALLVAPWRWWSRPASDLEPPRGPRFLLRWLLFRLMFSSAVVKLTSGDPTWRSFTALEYHYYTQPLPPWTAWYAHQLPAWAHGATVAVMFAVEGLVPLLLFGPRRVRLLAAATIAALQVGIIATGNYGFFNLLTLALCLPALDDGVWPERWRWWGRRARADAEPVRHFGDPWLVTLRVAGLAALFSLTLIPLLSALRWSHSWLGPVVSLYRTAAPLRIVGGYGLFSIMTTRRQEIVLEGSADGVEWREYEFRWKPGDLKRRPDFVAPHMPRLDWQMWFAALSDVRSQPWFARLCERILNGSPPVLALLESNPFPHAPPRYVRAAFYDYRFSDPATRSASGAWWIRTPAGLYCPALTLVEGRLSIVEPDSLR